jgi:hypothetical protein
MKIINPGADTLKVAIFGQKTQNLHSCPVQVPEFIGIRIFAIIL